ncbi:MAG: fluoride efflux transporter CrcB [Gaiella sp.]
MVIAGIAVAGALGALARYGLDRRLDAHGGVFPLGIFVVNISGALLIGFLVTWMEPRFDDVTWLRTAVLTGFLGAYTTFSTLSLDTYRLLDAGHLAVAFLNSVGSLAAGLAAVWIGIRLAGVVS